MTTTGLTEVANRAVREYEDVGYTIFRDVLDSDLLVSRRAVSGCRNNIRTSHRKAWGQSSSETTLFG